MVRPIAVPLKPKIVVSYVSLPGLLEIAEESKGGTWETSVKPP
jgi:hypothetical protein